jgi:uncharacterized protein YndB with AHSA1/START domain
MLDLTVTHATYVIERSYAAAPEKVFAAFADPAKKQRWFAPEDRGATRTESFEMDFRVGGHERARYRFQDGSPFPGQLMTNHTVYQDIVPARRIVFAYTMALGDHIFSASLATLELKPGEGGGTVLSFTEQSAFFEGSDGAEMRKEGWTGLLAQLASELAA